MGVILSSFVETPFNRERIVTTTTTTVTTALQATIMTTVTDTSRPVAKTLTSTSTVISISTTSVTTTVTNTKEESVINSTELVAYALQLINEDRSEWGVDPVQLGIDQSAQEHADDLASMCVLSHWDSGGMKPYMRYSLAGGRGVVAENVAFSGWAFNDPNKRIKIWTSELLKEEIKDLEYRMMYEDEHAEWGHRNNIVHPTHNKVSVGLAWTDYCFVYIQHFEDDYIQWIDYPILDSANILILSGIIHHQITEIVSLQIAYDPSPMPMTPNDLSNTSKHYSLGDWVGVVLPPPAEGWYYPDLQDTDVVAQEWSNLTLTIICKQKKQDSIIFNITANIESIIDKYGKGVYTIVLVVTSTNGETIMLTEISIFKE